MFAKAAFGLAIVLATASGAAAMKPDSQSVYTNVYNPLGACVGTDPDLNIRMGLNRDWGRGN